MVAWQTYLARNYFATGDNPKPLGGAHPNIVPYQVFHASDGYFVLAVGNDNLWNTFVEAMDMKSLENPKFKTNSDRVENRNLLISMLNEIFITKTRNEWVKLFESYKIPCGPVNNFSDILNDKHIKEREMVVEMNHPKLGILRQLGIPVKLSRTPGKIKSIPPEQGEHSD